MFFLFQLGLCAIMLIMSFISRLKFLNFNVGKSESIVQLGVICDVISIIAIAIYAIQVICAFIRRSNFAIHLAMSYLFALFLNTDSDLLGTLQSGNIDIPNFLASMIGMAWYTAWLIYLYCSKQIEKMFPVPTRVSRKRDYLPIIFIACPSIIWELIIIGY